MDDVLRQFLDGVEGLGPEPDHERLTAAVHDLAVDLDYWRFHIERAGESSIAIHRADRGVQVLLARRTDGTMSYVHSHEVWVALSAIEGVETHRRYDVRHVDDDRVEATLAEERRLHGGAGDVVTLVPPHDVHSHGHVRGSGDWPYTLIVLGDNQLRYQREEFDLTVGRRRILPPGDRGRPTSRSAPGDDPAGAGHVLDKLNRAWLQSVSNTEGVSLASWPRPPGYGRRGRHRRSPYRWSVPDMPRPKHTFRGLWPRCEGARPQTHEGWRGPRSAAAATDGAQVAVSSSTSSVSGGTSPAAFRRTALRTVRRPNTPAPIAATAPTATP